MALSRRPRKRRRKRSTRLFLSENNILIVNKITTIIMDKDFITLEEAKDQLIGEVGTQKRDDYEEELRLYAIGAAIRQTRKLQNLTQEELGRMVGVQKAQISRIENGKNLTFATVLKLFKAMNISVKLDIDKLGRVALC
jgi:DNA-binding XRE family transcriptional regulator